MALRSLDIAQLAATHHQADLTKGADSTERILNSLDDTRREVAQRAPLLLLRLRRLSLRQGG